MLRRPIERARGGGVRLRLSTEERTLLRRLPGELRRLLADEPDDGSLRRLFPPAYEDDGDEAEYRRLTRADLLTGRRRALAVLEETADRDRLTGEEAEGWLRALNDLRLVLGTQLDVTEELYADGIDPGHPERERFAVYGYLTWLQEHLVAALSPP